MMKILLNGATGAIGSRILNETIARGHDVTAVARDSHFIKTQVNLYSTTLLKKGINHENDCSFWGIGQYR